MISVVICSKDDAKFAQVHANLVQQLGEAHEIVRVVDARSICDGYNRGLAASHGDILIFCHDDIEVLRPGLAAKLRKHFERCDVVGVAGTTKLMAGGWVIAGPPYIFGQMAHPNPDGTFGICIYGVRGNLTPGVQALDGVFFACKRQVAESLRFDEVTFNGFHLYDVDFTFRAHLAGYRVAVAHDIPLIHFSGGSYDNNWAHYAKLFEQKHQGRLTQGPRRGFRFAEAHVKTKAEVIEVMTAWEEP